MLGCVKVAEYYASLRIGVKLLLVIPSISQLKAIYPENWHTFLTETFQCWGCLDAATVVGARDAAGREEFRLYLDAAIDVPGPQTYRLGEAAVAHESYVVMGTIGRDKFDFDVTGHYCRPDIFQLIVNEAPTPAVVTKTEA